MDRSSEAFQTFHDMVHGVLNYKRYLAYYTNEYHEYFLFMR